jgi:predicted HAD superfamily Cof-like phosphohydrolase
MTNVFEQQALFMIRCNQDSNRLNEEQAARYIAHLLEESAEVYEAVQHDDVVKTVDGLVDSIVVAVGGLISLLGTDGAQRAWDIVHDKNLSKVDGRFGPIRWRDDGQVGKPEGWQGPEAELTKLCVENGVIR